MRLNSDQFFKHYGFGQGELHTSMIVSETSEQDYVLHKVYLNKEEQLENMNRFADAVKLGIDSNGEELKHIILDNYVGEDLVTKFNRKNIIVL